jgi:hypothetical protein
VRGFETVHNHHTYSHTGAFWRSLFIIEQVERQPG